MNNNGEEAIPSADAPATLARRPTVSFHESAAKEANSQLQQRQEPNSASTSANVTSATTSATMTSPSSTASNASDMGSGGASSLIRKRGNTSSAASALTPHSPTLKSSPTFSSGSEATNLPLGRKRALSKTSPYHAASSSPLAIQPISPAMLLSNREMAPAAATGSDPRDSATTPAWMSSPSGTAGEGVKEYSSSLNDDRPNIPSSPNACQPQLVRINTGPGGRSLEVDTNPPTRMRKLTNSLARFYDKYSPSLTLENKGSIARDHLANERTYLAWLRTSLSLITVGVAVTQLFRLQSSGPGTPSSSLQISHMGRPLGGSFICLGLLFLWLGTSRYFHNQTVMSYGKFPASRGSVILATIAVLSVLLACLIIVILDKRK